MNCLIAFALAAIVFLPTVADALIMVGDGNKPAQNRSWPTGAEGVANLPSRRGYWAGPSSGEYHFEYQCQDTEEFNKALALFGKIRVPRSALQSYMSTNGQSSDERNPKSHFHGLDGLNWLTVGAHSFWRNPSQLEVGGELIHVDSADNLVSTAWGTPEDFNLGGRQVRRERDCYVLDSRRGWSSLLRRSYAIRKTTSAGCSCFPALR